VRVALGAAHGRIVRQLLTESLLLAAIGGIAGVVLGFWALDALVAMTPTNAPRVEEIRLDGTVLAFSALLTLATGLLFGLAPALQHSRGLVNQALREGARGSAGRGGRGLRRGLVAVEIGLALMLLTGGGLLLQTFVRLQAADLGFNPQNVLVGAVNPPRTSYPNAKAYIAFYDQLLEKISALPGVEKAALSSVLPLGGDSDSSFAIEGRPVPTVPSETPATWYRLVSASYFETMGMTIRQGRGFAAREPAPSIVVNETFAQRYFPGEDPLGRRIRFEREPWFTIIGIVGDVRARGAREAPRVEAFVPYWQQVEPGINVVVKASGSPERLTNPLKQAVYSIDRTVPVSGVRTLSSVVSESIEQPRFFALLSGALAMLALTLAAVGIYGVMAYAVSQRSSELGVRIALGATRREVFGLVVKEGLGLTGAGVALGLIGSVIVARWLAALLFGVGPADPVTLAAVTGTLLLVAALASIIPARRATRVDPIVALRGE
jgi:predicted permease